MKLYRIEIYRAAGWAPPPYNTLSSDLEAIIMRAEVEWLLRGLRARVVEIASGATVREFGPLRQAKVRRRPTRRPSAA